MSGGGAGASGGDAGAQDGGAGAQGAGAWLGERWDPALGWIADPPMRPRDYFDLGGFAHAALFASPRVWEALGAIEAYLSAWLATMGLPRADPRAFPGAHLDRPETIVIGEGTVIEPGAYLAGPAIIGRDCVIRHGAYVRGQVIAGDRVVIGHASEVKHSILLDEASAPHFAYVGDSILGRRVNLGAGTRLSNFPMTTPVVGGRAGVGSGQRRTIRLPARGHPLARVAGGGARPRDRAQGGAGEATLGDPSSDAPPGVRATEASLIDTGMVKLGAILGDDVQTGCNAVTHPGCLIGPRTLVYPNLGLRKGIYPGDHLLKLVQTLELLRLREG